MDEKSLHRKEIYLAGGCFWGTEKYLSMIHGVVKTQVGYANGLTQKPTYEDVCHNHTGHAETVKVYYNANEISLPFLLDLFYETIDPTSKNRQGGDRGTQYRTGIYYVDEADRTIILDSIGKLQRKYKKTIAIEVLPLENFYEAEESHQKYLDKNPGGYCHIHPAEFEKVKFARETETPYRRPSKETLENKLSRMQYEVTQNGATEPPFDNEYYDLFEKGIYVDVTTGEPLFISSDKFESGCGWPSFSRPISEELLEKLPDHALFHKRTEVRSKHGDAHLGHVFNDGPEDRGGLRYCINSASLRFIPKDFMAQEGYGEFLELIEN